MIACICLNLLSNTQRIKMCYLLLTLSRPHCVDAFRVIMLQENTHVLKIGGTLRGYGAQLRILWVVVEGYLGATDLNVHESRTLPKHLSSRKEQVRHKRNGKTQGFKDQVDN